MKPAGDDYRKRRDMMAARQAASSRAARDIAPMPPVQNVARKIAAGQTLTCFAETYFPEKFTLAWSPDHRQFIEDLQRGILHGGLKTIAMPRGSGKTTLCQAAACWAMCIGVRRFFVLVGATDGHAQDMLDSIKTMLSSNALLLADFPEVIYPIQRLEGIAQRAQGQTFNAKPTAVEWSNDKIIMPTIPGSRSSGAILICKGLTAGIRGLKHDLLDGTSIRPDFVLIDDPQTEESAKSPGQVKQRDNLIQGGVLGLAGPNQKISAVMTVTVIARDDLADRYLNPQKHPEWHGQRSKMLYGWPIHEDLWLEYDRMRKDAFRSNQNGDEATAFYAAQREKMDDGVKPGWFSRFIPSDEISAVQHAMNLYFDRGRSIFSAEYQNEPVDAERGDELPLTATDIAAKVNGLPRAVIGLDCDRVTAYIDVQGEVLYWVACAFGQGFTGSVIDYGTFPDQKKAYFTLADLKYPLSKMFPTSGVMGRIYTALEKLTADLFARRWRRMDGVELKLSLALIDSKWGKSTATVTKFAQQSVHGVAVMAAQGRGIGASAMPMEEYTRKPGETMGEHWMIPSNKGKSGGRYVMIDTNYWKTAVQDGWRTPIGDQGALSVWGNDGNHHQMLADHCTAEFGVTTTGRNRTLTEWRIKPGRPDNHLGDCLVGSFVAAAMTGVTRVAGPVLLPRKAVARRTRTAQYF